MGGAEGDACGGTGAGRPVERRGGGHGVHGTEVRALTPQEALRARGDWDATLLVTAPGDPPPECFADAVRQQYELDPPSKEAGSVCVVRCEAAGGGRLVLASTGALSPYDDVRSVGEAMRAAMKRAMSCAGPCAGAEAGAGGGEGRRVLVWLQPTARFPRAPLVALLGALEAIYMPLQLRESFPLRCERMARVGVCGPLVSDLPALVRTAIALEDARGVARDVGGADPERMTPLRAAELLCGVFAGTGVRVRVLTDAQRIADQYPLLAAVSRAADTVSRHRSCVVYLEYEPPHYERTLMFVGKGVTYDTGGADIKAGGVMAGMSRDKCGAAAIAGFFQALWSLRDSCGGGGGGVKAVCALGLVRNSVGEESYVADELLTSRRGLPVRVGNTDAEGRLVMGDLLAEMAERAASERNPHVYTVATLTGHAVRAVGDGYSIVLDNHAAAARGHARALQTAGETLGDMIEISTIRREDLRAHRGQSYGDALLQADNKPSTQVPRGHQGPAAFMMQLAGLDTGDIPYSHIDIAASAGALPAPPTAAPLLALAAHAGLLAHSGGTP